jgi:BlaI family penicillinase repressor
MHLIWCHGPITSEFVRERLSRGLKESTVRSVLQRLEDKGYVRHTLDGRTYIYNALESRGRIAAKAIKCIADRYCDGSLAEVWTGVIDAGMLDPLLLRTLANRLSKAKATKTKR